MMTIDEMKGCLEDKIPEAILFGLFGGRGNIMWETEGMQACIEGENLLIGNKDDENSEIAYYDEQLLRVVSNNFSNEIESINYFDLIHAGYKQRLEALCRTWFPERFQ